MLINRDFIDVIFFISSLTIAYLLSKPLIVWLTLSTVITYFTLRASYRYVLIAVVLALVTQVFNPTDMFVEFLTYYTVVVVVRSLIGFRRTSILYLTPVLIACVLSILRFTVYEFSIFNALVLTFISLISGYGLAGFQALLIGLGCEFKDLNLTDLRLPSLNILFKYLSRAFSLGILTYLLFLTIFRFTTLGFFSSILVSLVLTTIISITSFRRGLNVFTYALAIVLLIINYDYIAMNYFESYEGPLIEEVLRRFDGFT